MGAHRPTTLPIASRSDQKAAFEESETASARASTFGSSACIYGLLGAVCKRVRAAGSLQLQLVFVAALLPFTWQPGRCTAHVGVNTATLLENLPESLVRSVSDRRTVPERQQRSAPSAELGLSLAIASGDA